VPPKEAVQAELEEFGLSDDQGTDHLGQIRIVRNLHIVFRGPHSCQLRQRGVPFPREEVPHGVGYTLIVGGTDERSRAGPIDIGWISRQRGNAVSEVEFAGRQRGRDVPEVLARVAERVISSIGGIRRRLDGVSGVARRITGIDGDYRLEERLLGPAELGDPKAGQGQTPECIANLTQGMPRGVEFRRDFPIPLDEQRMARLDQPARLSLDQFEGPFDLARDPLNNEGKGIEDLPLEVKLRPCIDGQTSVAPSNRLN
jgi:hypothetical protein